MRLSGRPAACRSVELSAGATLITPAVMMSRTGVSFDERPCSNPCARVIAPDRIPARRGPHHQQRRSGVRHQPDRIDHRRAGRDRTDLRRLGFQQPPYRAHGCSLRIGCRCEDTPVAGSQLSTRYSGRCLTPVQPAQVFADQAQRDQLHAVAKQDHAIMVASWRPVAPQQGLGDDPRAIHEGDERGWRCRGRRPQRRGAEAGDAQREVFRQLPETELAAPLPRARLVERHPPPPPIQPNRPS